MIELVKQQLTQDFLDEAKIVIPYLNAHMVRGGFTFKRNNTVIGFIVYESHNINGNICCVPSLFIKKEHRGGTTLRKIIRLVKSEFYNHLKTHGYYAIVAVSPFTDEHMARLMRLCGINVQVFYSGELIL